MRVSACVNGTRPVGIVCWWSKFDVVDGNIYLSEWWSGLIGILFANWAITLPPLPLPFVGGRSPLFVLLFGKNDDEIPDDVGNVLSDNECPSEEPLLIIVDVGKRSFSVIWRESNDDCWETIDGSIEFDDDDSRGMFVFDKPDPEYNDDGNVVLLDNAVDDDGALIWERLLSICWVSIP
jgi:hypothetical protein